MMKKLFASSDSFESDLNELRSLDLLEDQELDRKVGKILRDIRLNGDSAVLSYVKEFEREDVKSMSDLKIDPELLASSWKKVSEKERNALSVAIERIETFHHRQIESSWSYTDGQNNLLGQQITPINRAGVYIPGGRASYPSTALMTVIPAKVAGVREIAIATPVIGQHQNDLLFAALYKLGVEEIYGFGGAQSIGALSFGTESISRVDKIVGPGGLYVTAAKRKMFGFVGIDSIAGPTELVIFADSGAPIDWLVLDFLSQAEHDPSAQSILVSQDREYIEKFVSRVYEVFPKLSRQEIIGQSLEARCAAIQVNCDEQAIEIINLIAPEHLQLCVERPEQYLDQIMNAGAIFCGNYSTESFGDYLAGPSHVLPTFGSARFSSPLGVYDFVKKSSVIGISQEGATLLSEPASIIADSEGLEAHALASRIRGLDFDSNILK